MTKASVLAGIPSGGFDYAPGRVGCAGKGMGSSADASRPLMRRKGRCLLAMTRDIGAQQRELQKIVVSAMPVPGLTLVPLAEEAQRL